MTQLTERQKRDISFLMTEHAYNSIEATNAVVGAKTKVRAPTMEQLDQLSASQIKELSKC